MRLVRTATVALLAGVCSPYAEAQPFGRLFHTAGERAALDAQRKAKPQPHKPAASRPSADPQHVDGYVVRSDGKSTLWINGSAVPGAR